MKYQFIKNCPQIPVLMNKSYRKYNVITNCFKSKIFTDSIIHYTKMSIELIPIEFLKEYKH